MIDINLATPAELETELSRLAHEAEKADKKFIEANEKFEILDDAKKPYLSVLMDGFEVKTTAEKERLAYASLDYADWLNRYQLARKEARIARVERDSMVRQWETIRSILSSRNTSRRTGV